MVIPTTLEKEKIFKESRAEEQCTLSKPSKAWYLIPIFLGLIGRVIGYFALKDENRKMANDLLELGITMTFLVIFFIFIYFSRSF